MNGNFIGIIDLGNQILIYDVKQITNLSRILIYVECTRCRLGMQW